MKKMQRMLAAMLAAAMLLAGCGKDTDEEAATPEQAGPDLSVFENEQPDTATPAWSKNSEGWYVNTSGYRIRGAMERGLDVSEWQGDIDWEKVAASDFSFAILRCGAGGEWDGMGEYTQDDERWRQNADGCTQAGIPFGCYLYSYATTEEMARSEADHVARLLGLVEPPLEGLEDYTDDPYTLELPVYLDLENANMSGMFPEQMAAVVEAFCARLAELGYTGEVGLYSNTSWMEGRLTGEYFEQFSDTLWVAQYADACTYGGAYAIWQSSHSVDGTEFGVPASIDVNFRMTTAALAEEEIALAEGESFALEGRAVPSESRLVYESADPSVAAVDADGVVTALAAGSTVVTAQTEDGLAQAQCVVNVGPVDVTVLCTGNIRGDVSAGAGLDTLAALKVHSGSALLVDCGNSLQGTDYAALTAGQAVAGLMSAAGYDAQSVGRYDLAYGRAKLIAAASCQNSPTLAANLLGGSGPVLYGSSYRGLSTTSNGARAIVRAGGKNIGVFGLTSTDAEDTAAGNGMLFASYADAAALEIENLTAEGADAIVMLCDLDSVSLRQTLDGLSDSKLELLTGVASSGLEEESRGYTRGEITVPIAMASGGLHSVGRLQLHFEPGSVQAKADLLDETNLNSLSFDGQAAEAYSAMQVTMERYAAEYQEDCAEVFVWNMPQGAAGTADTALGDLAADAYAATARQALGEESTGYVAALTAGGSEHSSGMVTAGDCLELLPAGQTVQLTVVNGEALRGLLEQYAAQGVALQCSGLTYSINADGSVGDIAFSDGTALTDSASLYLAADSGLTAQLSDSRVMLDLGDAYYLAETEILQYTNAGDPIPAPDGRITA